MESTKESVSLGNSKVNAPFLMNKTDLLYVPLPG